MHATLRALLAFALISGVATAQLAGPGLRWSGSSGAFAGSYLPSCSNLPVTAMPGEIATVSVWGDIQAPFALFAASSGTQCLPIPGVGNALILDQPIVTMAFGTLTLVTPCLSCPPGFENLTFVIPRGLPAGISLALQAASFGAGNLSFTVAITATL